MSGLMVWPDRVPDHAGMMDSSASSAKTHKHLEQRCQVQKCWLYIWFDVNVLNETGDMMILTKKRVDLCLNNLLQNVMGQ